MTRRQPSTFGEVLARIRRLRGLTQEELAARVGVHVNSVSAWERGASVPGFDRIAPLSRALGVRSDVFVDLPRRGLERYLVD